MCLLDCGVLVDMGLLWVVDFVFADYFVFVCIRLVVVVC